MRYIDCEVNDEYVIGSGVVIGASGSHNDVGLRLKFGDMWVGLNIYATFTDANGEGSAVVMLMPSMLDEGEAMTYLLPIPAEAKRYAGKSMLTLSGYSKVNGTQVDKATNTVTAFFRVLKSNYRLLTDSSVTPTLAQQLHSEVNSLGERIEETETDVADIREDMADIEDKIDKIQAPDSNIPEWALQPNKPSYSKEEVGLANVDNVKQYSASNPPPYPVTSVNGQAGDVRLGAEDVGAMPVGTKIPAKTSDITNDSGFITKVVSDLANYYTKSQTFTRDEINAKISAIPKFAIEVVSSLPTSNISATTVYLVGGGSGNDLYTEYIYANGKWEILGAQTVDLTGYATETWVNIQLGAYLKQSELEAAINTALATAKASGEFDGADGERGTGILNTTTGIASYTTTVNGIKPTYRIALTTLKTQSKVSDVIVGDTVRYSYFLYPIIYVDADYAYMGTRVSIQGATGTPGKDGSDGDDYVLTEADKAEIAVIVEDNAKGEIIQSIVAELQTFPVFGYIDENNAITVTSLLLDGTYTLKYENEDGTKTEIGTIIVGTGTGEGSGGDYTPTYVNIISTAKTPTDLTTVFNGGKGYMDGKYASSSSPYYGADSATFVTGLIEATPTSVFYIKGVTIDTSNNHNRLGVFNTSGSPNAVKPFTQMTDYATLETLGTQYYKLTMNTTYISANFTNFKYIMFSAMGSGANCIIATTPIEE